MFYDSLSKYVTDVEQFRGAPTIYELRQMPYESMDEKVEVSIRLTKLVNGLKYKGLKLELKKVAEFNERIYKQAISSAITYARKPEMAVGFLYKILVVLVQDINRDMPKFPDSKMLKTCIESEADEYGVRSFSRFFELELSDFEKKEIKKSEMDGGLTGLKDLDWKAMSFLEELEDGKKISLTERFDLNKLLNVNITYLIDTKIKEGTVSDELQDIYTNIEKVKGNKRRGVLQQILTAILFNQTVDKYPTLIQAKEKINIKK